QAFSFDGDNDFISVPDSPDWDFGTNNFTIDLWVLFNREKPTLFIHQQEGATAGGWEFFYQNGELRFNSDGSTNVIARSFTPVAGQWYHLAVVREGNAFRLYADGEQLGADEINSAAL